MRASESAPQAFIPYVGEDPTRHRIDVTTLGDLLLKAFDQYPDHPALIFPESAWTWSGRLSFGAFSSCAARRDAGRPTNSNASPRTTAPVGLTIGRWHHLAGVSGKSGMRLYLDGVLVGTNGYKGSFSSLRNGDRCFLGTYVGSTETPQILKSPSAKTCHAGHTT